MQSVDELTNGRCKSKSRNCRTQIDHREHRQHRFVHNKGACRARPPSWVRSCVGCALRGFLRATQQQQSTTGQLITERGEFNLNFLVQSRSAATSASAPSTFNTILSIDEGCALTVSRKAARMALTFQQIILDAGKLVNEISTQENTADVLICEIQSVCSQIDSMKQYQEDLESLNATQTSQKPRQELIAGFQKGNNGYFRELQAENKDLRLALEDYQKALEQIMSKYRQQTAYFLKQTKTDFTAIPNKKCCQQYNQCKCINIINKQAEKISEMATVMRTAAQIDEENEMKYVETLGRLKKENIGLREILDMANKYNCPKSEISVESKTVQTDDL